MEALRNALCEVVMLEDQARERSIAADRDYQTAATVAAAASEKLDELIKLRRTIQSYLANVAAAEVKS